MSDPSERRADGGTAVSCEGARPATGAAPRERVRWLATVARQEYRLSIRNRWALALVGLFAALSVVVVGVEGARAGPTRVDVVVVSLASLATYLVPLAAIAYGYDAVVGADEAGWLEVVFALPADRGSIVAGTYLGRAGTLASATLVGFAPAGVLLLGTGPVAPAPYAAFVLGAVALGLAFLALAVLLSTVATEETHALGLGLATWVWFVFAHDLLALGAVATFDLRGPAVSAFVLANPADVFRVIVLEAAGATGGGPGSVFANTGLSAPVAVLALLAWCAVPVLLAGRLVGRRSV